MFKNFIVIDTWKFTSSPDILNEIIKTIYIAISNIIYIKGEETKNKESLKKLEKIFEFIFPKLVITAIFLDGSFSPENGILNFGIDIYKILKELFNKKIEIKEENKKEKEQNKEKKSFHISLEEINSMIEPSIIVFDNIERMGKHSWEIIKTIQQLSIFDNLLFLLPINKSQLKFGNDSEYEMRNESAIDKYITLGTYFELKQDYLGVLNKLNFDNESANLINNILNESIDGYNLSTRLVERGFENKEVKKYFVENKYEGLKKIKEIWNSKIINKEIENDFEDLKNDFNDLYKIKNFYHNSELNNIIDFIESHKESNNSLIPFFNYFEDFTNTNYNFLIDIDIEKWLSKQKDLNNKLNELILCLNNIFDDKSKNIKIINQKIAKLELKNRELEEEKIQSNSSTELIRGEKTSSLYSLKKIEDLNILFNSNQLIYDNNIKDLELLKGENNYLCSFLKEINELIEGNVYISIKNIKIYIEKFKQKVESIKNNKNKSFLVSTLISITSLFDKNLYTNVFQDQELKEKLINKILNL
ncbi:MAG: hypothetical protein ACRC9U_03445 [Metamycoplasmataceae bacterium]